MSFLSLDFSISFDKKKMKTKKLKNSQNKGTEDY
jgi:hypothetical protein